MRINKNMLAFCVCGMIAMFSTFSLYMLNWNGGAINTVLAVAFWCLYWHFYKKYKTLGKVKGIGILSLILGAFFGVGNCVAYNASFGDGIVAIGKAVVVTIGAAAFYYVALTWFYQLLHMKNITLFVLPKKITNLFEKHPFGFSFVLLMCCYSVHLILKYPAGMCWDVGYQIEQGIGNAQLTTHHPLAHTFLVTAFVLFGQKIGSVAVGMFLCVIFGAVVTALIFSYVIAFLHRIKTYNWCFIGTIVFFAISPYVTGYIGQPVKDFWYSVFCVFFLVMIAELLHSPEYFWKHIKCPILFVVSVLGVVLFRNNGSYILIPTMIVLIIYELKKYKAWKRALFLLLSCVLSLGMFKSLEIFSGAEKGSIKEALSLPFQQTARLVTYYPNSITEEEREIINQILPYDELPELYHEHISDPVKDSFHQEATTEELKAYLKVWFAQFLREPGCYVEATVSQNIYLIYPGYNNYTYYIDGTNMVYPHAEEELFSSPEMIQKIQVWYKRYFGAMHKLPILYLINNMATYIILMIAMAFYAVKDKQKTQLLYLLPCYLSTVIIILAPVIRNHVRYALPIIYAFPLLIGVYCASLAKKDEEKMSDITKDLYK